MKVLTPTQEGRLFKTDTEAWSAYLCWKYAEGWRDELLSAIPERVRTAIREAYADE